MGAVDIHLLVAKKHNVKEALCIFRDRLESRVRFNL